MKFWKLLFAFVCFALPTVAQPIEKPSEAELPHLSVAELSEMVGGPTTVSLHYENADFDAVLKEVSQKFGVPLALSPRTSAKGPVSLDLPGAPLWKVWETLREQVQYDRKGPSETPRRALLLTPVLAGRTYATYDTPLFQVRTLGLRLSDKSWTMTLAVIADPKIEIGASSSRVRLTEMVDDEGHNLLDDEIRSSTLYLNSPSLYYASLARKRPEKIGKRLVSLKGVISAYAIVKRQSWQISLADLPVEKTTTRNGITEIISATSVQNDKEKDRYNVELSRAIKSLINYRFWSSAQTRFNNAFNYALFSSVQLQDAQDRNFSLRKTSVDANYNDEAYFYTWSGRFERTPENKSDDDIKPEGEPAKLIWSVPTSIERFEIPFELTDVPIN